MADAAIPQAWVSFTESAAKMLEATSLDQVRQTSAEDVDIDRLRTAGLAELAGSHILRSAQDAMATEHIAKFWAQLSDAAMQAAELEAKLVQALQELSSALERQSDALDLLSKQLLQNERQRSTGAASAQLKSPPVLLTGLASRFRAAATAMLQISAPISLSGLLEQYYTDRLAEFSTASRSAFGNPDEEEEDESEMMETTEAHEAGDIMGDEWVSRLHTVSEALSSLGIQDMGTSACAAAVCKHVREKLNSRAGGGDFSQAALDPAIAYVDAVPLPFLKAVSKSQGQAALSGWQRRLSSYVYQTIGCLRIASFFDMVVDYPDSLPALEDLCECLQHTNLHSHFISRFRSAIQQRLLHAGAATPDILSTYISTIKSLREVDPKGVLLNAVGEPIQAYLRERKDTIRCIVMSLTDDGSGGEAVITDSLFEELSRAADPLAKIEEDADPDDWAGLQAALLWQPDPVEVGLVQRSKERSSDIIAMLVSVYGTRELFINEYRSLLAERLLAKTDYDCEREIRTLELLKIRFGEVNLHNCEVMLKDMADSKRVNGNIRQMPQQALSPLRRQERRVTPVDTVSATIISALFWPPLQEDKFNLPAEVQERLEAYAARFFVLKTPRKLVWHPNLGSVDLHLTVGDAALDLTVTPIQATLLMHFKAREEWPATQLAHAVGLTTDVLRKRIMFWIHQGVLRESQTGAGLVYTRCESLQAQPSASGKSGQGWADERMEDADLNGDRGTSHGNAGMAVFEQFIMGMLTNFDGGLPLDRIHNMLKMFVVEPPYDKTSEELEAFLRQLAAEEKIAIEAGLYKKRT